VSIESPGSQAPETLYVSGLVLIVPTLWNPRFRCYAQALIEGSISGPAPEVLAWVEKKMEEMITNLAKLHPGLDWKKAYVKCHGSLPLKVAIERFYHYQFLEGKVNA